MPYSSLRQERWAHTAAGRKALGSKVAEFDSASKGLKLPASKHSALVKAAKKRKRRA